MRLRLAADAHLEIGAPGVCGVTATVRGGRAASPRGRWPSRRGRGCPRWGNRPARRRVEHARNRFRLPWEYRAMSASPLRPHGATPAELAERQAAQRRGVPFLVYRDGDGAQVIVELTVERVT